MSQKQQIIDHLRSGREITQLEATKCYGITRLAAVIHDLRHEDGYSIKNIERIAKKSNRTYVAYVLCETNEVDDHPELFPETEGRVQRSDSVDISNTPLEKGKPPQVGGTEVFSHHVANPGDAAQILASFREYCAGFGGKRVPITADWARQVLKLNRDFPDDSGHDQIRNRDLNQAKRKRTLEDFKQAMRDGEFRYTAIGIGFDEDGWLSDGQTRLTACLETGITFYADVTFDVDREAFSVIDSPDSARSSTDFAYMYGITENRALVSAVVSHLYRKEYGLNHTKKLKPKELIEALRRYDDVGPSIQIAKKFKMVRAPKGIIAAVHYLASKVDKGVADKTFADFISGANLGVNDPVLVARERLRRAYQSPANEFRGGGDKRVRIMLSRMFNYRRHNIKTSKFLLDGGDDWPGDKPKV